MAEENTNDTADDGGGKFGGPAPTTKVYVFNTTNQSVGVTLNGNGISALQPTATVSAQNYIPSASPIARSSDPTTTTAVFAQTNTMILGFFSGNDTYTNFTLKVPLQNDVLIYVFAGYIVVADTTGNINYTQSIAANPNQSIAIADEAGGETGGGDGGK
jgi:hypothetical protein